MCHDRFSRRRHPCREEVEINHCTPCLASQNPASDGATALTDRQTQTAQSVVVTLLNASRRRLLSTVAIDRHSLLAASAVAPVAQVRIAYGRCVTLATHASISSLCSAPARFLQQAFVGNDVLSRSVFCYTTHRAHIIIDEVHEWSIAIRITYCIQPATAHHSQLCHSWQ